jgi:hypothetical protein
MKAWIKGGLVGVIIFFFLFTLDFSFYSNPVSSAFDLNLNWIENEPTRLIYAFLVLFLPGFFIGAIATLFFQKLKQTIENYSNQ